MARLAADRAAYARTNTTIGTSAQEPQLGRLVDTAPIRVGGRGDWERRNAEASNINMLGAISPASNVVSIASAAAKRTATSAEQLTNVRAAQASFIKKLEEAFDAEDAAYKMLDEAGVTIDTARKLHSASAAEQALALGGKKVSEPAMRAYQKILDARAEQTTYQKLVTFLTRHAGSLEGRANK